jgi:hypothetical protein
VVARAGVLVVVDVAGAVVVLDGCAVVVVAAAPEPQPTAPMMSAVTAAQTMIVANKRLFMGRPISSRRQEVRERT